jgi:hypothetical protein
MNPSVLPATFSARATAASLADWTIRAYNISSTVNDSFSASQTWEPPVLEALARILHKPVEQKGGRGVRELENTELYDDTLYRPEHHRL